MLLNAINASRCLSSPDSLGTTTDPVETNGTAAAGAGCCLSTQPALTMPVHWDKCASIRLGSAFDRTDLGLIVSDGTWGQFEETILLELKKRSIPAIAVFNKSDVQPPLPQTLKSLAGRQISCIQTAAFSGDGIDALRQPLLIRRGEFIDNPVIAADLVGLEMSSSS